MDKIRKGSDLRKEKWGSPSIQESKIAAMFSKRLCIHTVTNCVTFPRRPGSTAIPWCHHSRPQRLRSIWPAPWIETSGGGLDRSRSVSIYGAGRGHDPWRWPNGSQPLGTRMIMPHSFAFHSSGKCLRLDAMFVYLRGRGCMTSAWHAQKMRSSNGRKRP